MQIDLHAKSQQLLEALANSIYDRDPKTNTPFFFNIAEVHITEHWINTLIEEIERELVV